MTGMTFRSCSCACLSLLLASIHSFVMANELQRIVSDRQSLQSSLSSAAQQNVTQVKAQRGIVIPCGGGQMLANAYVAARVLRNYLECDLPIEIAYFGEHEIDAYHKHLFLEISSTSLVDLSAVHRLDYKADASIGGYAIKAFAIIYSSFAEVLCLDSDNMPVHNPAALFDTAAYKDHGNIFWSDPNINGLDTLVYQMFGLQPPWEADEAFLASESGQILLNRQRHADVLQWLWFLTANSGFFYPRMHGDKDTYRLAFALAAKTSEYVQVKSGPQLGLTPWKRPEGLFYLSAGFVQPGLTDSIAFYHRVERGAKINPASPIMLSPLFITTTLSYTWRRPAGTVWFDVEFGGGGIATHYPSSGVNTTAYRECCSSAASKAASSSSAPNHHTYTSACSCRETSSMEDHKMIAIPVSYFPAVRRVLSIAQKIFLNYQHDLWLHEQTIQG